MDLLRAARLVWASPASAVGIALSPFFENRFIVRGVLLCEGARWPRRLGWRYRAVAFGHVVLSVDDLDPATLEHELAHVAQYERWGAAMLPAYAAAAGWTALRGGHPHHDNHFERAARGSQAGP